MKDQEAMMQQLHQESLLTVVVKVVSKIVIIIFKDKRGCFD